MRKVVIIIDSLSNIEKREYNNISYRIVKGSWNLTSKNINLNETNNQISCYLKNMKGDWVFNNLIFNKNLWQE